MRIALAAAVIATACLSSTPVRSEDQVAALNMDEWGFVASGWALEIGRTGQLAAQEFVPTTNGKLTTITATVDVLFGGASLVASIHSNSDGVPGTELGSITVPESDVVTWHDWSADGWALTVLDFSAFDVNLVAGESYFLTFRAETHASMSFRGLLTLPNEILFGLPALGSIDGGTTWIAHHTAYEIGLMVCVSAPILPQEVAIDVDPGSSKNFVKLNSKKPKPLDVAVLGDADLNVFDIVPETARLGDPALTDPLLRGATPVAPTGFEYADVDDDGDEDLVLVFDVGAMEAAGAIAQSSSMLTLEAEKSNGRFVFGSDLVHPKTKKAKKPRKAKKPKKAKKPRKPKKRKKHAK